MNRKLLKQLTRASYTNNKLDEKNVLAIADRLNRSELKQYIAALKSTIQKKTVTVEVPSEKLPFSEKDFEQLFSGKNVDLKTNPDLLLGIRIIDNDTIYDMTLRNRLSDIAAQIVE